VPSIIAVTGVMVLAVVVYFSGVPGNPPGFYVDESSVAYNAYTISQTARDEHGVLIPLYFRSFGDYKNPTYVYLLALLFRVFGPSLLIARLLSAALGLLAAVALGMVAVRITGRRGVGVILGLQALLTPWIFENSRLALEVALYPLVLAMFLRALARSATRASWSLSDALALALTLSLLTYTYSIGRLLAPLLALGLVLFANRRSWRGIMQTWFIYFVMLLPLLVFAWRNPGALTGRFRGLSYITQQSTVSQIASEFVKHYVTNVSPWRLLITGEMNLRDHVPGTASILLATAALAALSCFLLLRRRRGSAWWSFIFYGLLVSPIPASLTINEFPTLRLIALPVFLLVLTIPAVSWLMARSEESALPVRDPGANELKDASLESGPSSAKAEHKFFSLIKRPLLVGVLVLILLQGLFFVRQFHRAGSERGYIFDSHYAGVLDAAINEGKRPVYLRERPGGIGYIQAYWYATLRGIDVSRFIRLEADHAPPANALVISTEEDCPNCRLILRSVNYIVYITNARESGLVAGPLPGAAFRARLSLADAPASLRAGQKINLNVSVENLSEETWPAFGTSDGKHAVVLRNIWRDAATNALITDLDGAGKLPSDLLPGGKTQVLLPITAPPPGEYFLEIDLVQNQTSWFVRPRDLETYIEEQEVAQRQVTWFHQRGSQLVRLKVSVLQ